MNIYLWFTAAWLFCGLVGMLLGDAGENLKRGFHQPYSVGMRLIIILWGVLSLIFGFCACCSGVWHFIKPKITKILDYEI